MSIYVYAHIQHAHRQQTMVSEKRCPGSCSFEVSSMKKQHVFTYLALVVWVDLHEAQGGCHESRSIRANPFWKWVPWCLSPSFFPFTSSSEVTYTALDVLLHTAAVPLLSSLQLTLAIHIKQDIILWNCKRNSMNMKKGT